MLKLDSNNRFQIPKSLLDAAMLNSNSTVNVIYSNGHLLFKQSYTCYGVDKIVDVSNIDSKGRVTISKHVIELLSIDKETVLFSWYQPGIIHLEKKEKD